MIKVLYSCVLCGIHRAEVSVPERTNEDVVYWVQTIVGNQIKQDHTSRSPECRATSVQDLMIPISGVEKIGGPVVQ
jgi:hypothetical protein